MKYFKFTVASDNGNVSVSSTQSVSFRTPNGEICIMSGHTPFACTVEYCTVISHGESSDTFIKTSGGFTVFNDNSLIMILKNAEFE